MALLHYWRAVGEDRRGYWFLLALDLGLLLLANYVGLILIALIVLFTLVTRAGAQRSASGALARAAALGYRRVSASGLALERGDPRPRRFQESMAAAGALTPWLWLGRRCSSTQLGLVLLVALASGWPRKRNERAPEIDRNPVEPFARLFVYAFALTPALVALGLASPAAARAV